MTHEKATERVEKRLALLATRKAAKALKKKFRYDQHRYLHLKREKLKLTRAEREAYKASIQAFNDLCAELRIVAASLKHARLEVEMLKALPRQAREALIYSKGFNEGRAMEKQAQAELAAARTPRNPS
jgi:hypothetical protein